MPCTDIITLYWSTGWSIKGPGVCFSGKSLHSWRNDTVGHFTAVEWAGTWAIQKSEWLTGDSEAVGMLHYDDDTVETLRSLERMPEEGKEQDQLPFLNMEAQVTKHNNDEHQMGAD